MSDQDASQAQGERALLAHARKMQEACANYIEPTTYIARHPDTGKIGDCAWVREFPMPDQNASDHGKAEANARRDAAFIRDMIYMLDGPEQRAAMLPAPGATAQDGVHPAIAAAYHGLSATPTPTIPAGMVAARKAWRRVQQAHRVGDPHGFEHHAAALTEALAAAPKQAEQQGVEALREADQAVVKMMAQSDAELVIDAMKAMRADDVKAAVRAWLDADDATHWGAFEVALHAAVEGVSERDSVVAMLQADAETMRQNATAYSEEAPTDARALYEVAATLAFKAAQIKRGDHLAALNAPTGAVEKGEGM